MRDAPSIEKKRGTKIFPLNTKNALFRWKRTIRPPSCYLFSEPRARDVAGTEMIREHKLNHSTELTARQPAHISMAQFLIPSTSG